MNYDEIIKTAKTSKEKEELLKQFYLEEVKITDWLTDDAEEQFILFSDHKEYKKFGKYHRLNGPAIDYGDKQDKWFIEGKEYEQEEWKKISLNLLRKEKYNRLKDVD